MKKPKMGVILLMLGWLLVPLVTSAVMSSSNYTIYADTFSLGGDLSTSTNYSLQGSAVGVPVGISTSSTYEIRAGYQAMEYGSISVDFSKNSLDLGVLSPVVVKSDSTVVTISIDSPGGYTLSLGSVSAAPLAPVSGGAVVAGTEGYGIAVTGANRSFINDQPIAANLILASTNSSVVSDQETLVVKAAIGSNSNAIGLSGGQTIAINGSANF